MKDFFDLEQQMMECWNVVDDIDTVFEQIERLDMPAEAQDELSCALLGLKTIYRWKFEKFQSMLEECIANAHANRSEHVVVPVRPIGILEPE